MLRVERSARLLRGGRDAYGRFTVSPVAPLCRWLGVWSFVVLATMLAAAEARLELSAAEREWVDAHPVVRVGVDPGWPPFSVTRDGACAGIDPDLLERIGSRLGVRFEIETRKTWEAVYEAARRGEMDLLAGTALTAERAEDFVFTEPYFSFPVVVVMRNDEPLLWSMLDLRGKRVVGVRGYAPTSEMQRMDPSLEFRLVDTTDEALREVARRDADAFVSNLPNVSFVAKTHGLTNLKIAGVIPVTFDLRYAVRPDWPELVDLLNRAIAATSEAERQEVVHPWIRVDYAKVIRWDLVWKTSAAVLSVLGVVIGAIGYHNRRLSRELVERIRLQNEIKEAHDELVRLNEEKTEMLQMAAHDLRGPLTSMQLVVDASLRLGAVPKDRGLQMVEQQVRQMTGLLNDLLDAEALETGRREFRMERLSPAVLLQAAVAGQEQAAARKGVRLEVRIAPGLPMVNGDATALRQVFDNLLSNAIKFTPKESAVTAVMEMKQTHVRLEVRDEGPGVAADETERVFTKYARGRAKPTAGEKSTGLGLAIVRQLATSMNGRVWCESTGGRGGLFVVMLPAAE